MTLAILKGAGFILYMALEYWLGKTGRTKANSVLELIENKLKRK